MANYKKGAEEIKDSIYNKKMSASTQEKQKGVQNKHF